MTSADACILHGEKQEKMCRDISEIKDALLGTLKEKGFITVTDERIKSLESFKSIQIWLTRGIVGSILAGIGGALYKLLI